jgi:hypothetical protein
MLPEQKPHRQTSCRRTALERTAVLRRSDPLAPALVVVLKVSRLGQTGQPETGDNAEPAPVDGEHEQ